MKKYDLLFATILLMVFASCSKTDNGKVEYIPFQESTDGQWGMISMDGKVLFSEEFKNKPTIVRDGRFFVLTKSGIWEMYDASEKPKKIGGDYTHTSGFRNGIALVAEKGKPVSIIDTEGKTIKLLDKIEKKEVDGVRAFNQGYAVFQTTDSLFGVIDEKGDCVIKPEYFSLNNCGDGKFIGVNIKYKEAIKKDKKGKTKVSVLDTSGKILMEFNGDKYDDIAYEFTDGLLPVCVKKDGKITWGIINDKGETIVKPSSKIKNIGTIHGDCFTYNNGEGWGLMNTKGETLIRAKYEFLYYDDDNVLVAVIKEGDSEEYKYVDEKDNQLGNETYVKATLYSMFDGEHALVKPNDKIYSIIDKKGKQVEGLPDIINVGTYEGEGYVESDYVDINKLLSEIKINEEGLLGITFNSSPKEVVELSVKDGSAPSSAEHPAGSAYWYDYRSKVYFTKKVQGVTCGAAINFTDNLSKQTYRSQRVIDYDFGDYYYYHTNKIPTGYVWNNVKPWTYAFLVSNDGKMKGKLRDLFNALCSKFKSIGKVAKENNGAMVITLKNGKIAVIYMKKDSVVSTWGNLKDPNEIDIDEYKDVSEEYDESNISFGYLNGLFPDEVRSEAAVDSVAVDVVD